MKRIYSIVLILFLGLTSYSQTPISYSEIHEVKGTKDEIYNKVKTWVGETFTFPRIVTKIDDKENGIVMVGAGDDYAYSLKNGLKINSRISYSCKIYIKDNKVKIEMYDFSRRFLEEYKEYNPCVYGTIYNRSYTAPNGYVEYYRHVQNECDRINKRYQDRIMKFINTEVDNDW